MCELVNYVYKKRTVSNTDRGEGRFSDMNILNVSNKSMENIPKEQHPHQIIKNNSTHTQKMENNKIQSRQQYQASKGCVCVGAGARVTGCGSAYLGGAAG